MAGNAGNNESSDKVQVLGKHSRRHWMHLYTGSFVVFLSSFTRMLPFIQISAVHHTIKTHLPHVLYTNCQIISTLRQSSTAYPGCLNKLQSFNHINQHECSTVKIRLFYYDKSCLLNTCVNIIIISQCEELF